MIFMCFEVNSHANKPHCHVSGHFVTFVSLILTIAQPLLNMFQQDLHDQDLPVHNDSLGSMPAHHAGQGISGSCPSASLNK